MYKIKNGLNTGYVHLTKSFQGSNRVDLTNPTQAQLKYLFDLKHPYVEEIKQKKDV